MNKIEQENGKMKYTHARKNKAFAIVAFCIVCGDKDGRTSEFMSWN